MLLDKLQQDMPIFGCQGKIFFKVTQGSYKGKVTIGYLGQYDNMETYLIKYEANTTATFS